MANIIKKKTIVIDRFIRLYPSFVRHVVINHKSRVKIYWRTENYIKVQDGASPIKEYTYIGIEKRTGHVDIYDQTLSGKMRWLPRITQSQKKFEDAIGCGESYNNILRRLNKKGILEMDLPKKIKVALKKRLEVN